MNWLICAIVILIGSIVALVMLAAYNQEDVRNIEAESQKLMRLIEAEARRKNINADNMILNALKRVLETIKSL